MVSKNIKVITAVNTAWNLYNFRSGLIRGLTAEGYEVVAVAPHDDYASRMAELGCGFVELPMDNQGTHPIKDALLVFRFLRLLKRERPAVYLGFTAKPNIFGSLAAHKLCIPVINNIAGLGVAFNKGGWLKKTVCGLYRLSLSRSAKVFFQNSDDLAMFVGGGLVKPEVSDYLPGSGVDLKCFAPVPLPSAQRCPKFRFLLIARMLWDKGVGEYLEAARIVRREHPDVECCLLGFLDVKNPSAISKAKMDEWAEEGEVRYLGSSDNVGGELAQADCVVLPSYYREGTPRALLEGAAMGRPLITTDTPGCRDVVEHGVNGYLCRPRDSMDLAEKMKVMINLSCEARTTMGLKGREKVEREFDEQFVIQKYLDAIREILATQAK